MEAEIAPVWLHLAGLVRPRLNVTISILMVNAPAERCRADDLDGDGTGTPLPSRGPMMVNGGPPAAFAAEPEKP
jgi:hypothetical protein